MGGESCSRGRGFEYQQRILDGLFSHYIVVKVAMFAWNSSKKTKRDRGWHIFLNKRGGFWVDEILKCIFLIFKFCRHTHYLTYVAYFIKILCSKHTFLSTQCTKFVEHKIQWNKGAIVPIFQWNMGAIVPKFQWNTGTIVPKFQWNTGAIVSKFQWNRSPKIFGAI